MTVSALWTKHRPVAYALAHQYRIPGLEAQDVEQEALIALWEACRGFDKRKGRFPTFAKTVIRRHLTDLLRTATALKRTAELQRDTDVQEIELRAQAYRTGWPGLTLTPNALATHWHRVVGERQLKTPQQQALDELRKEGAP